MADYTMQSDERNKFLSALGNVNANKDMTAAQAESQRQALMFDRTARQGGMDAYSAEQMQSKVSGALSDKSLTRNQRAMALQNMAAQYATTLAPQTDAKGNQTNAAEINAFANAAGFMDDGNQMAQQDPAPPPPSAPPPEAAPPPQNRPTNLFQEAMPEEPSESSTIVSEMLNPQLQLSGRSTKVLEKQKPSMFDTALA
jgi:hypothetical protein